MRPKKEFTWRNKAGFTLIELLVVIIILGLLSALVAPTFFGRIDQAQIRTTKAQIELLGTALDSFRLDVGRYPTTQEGLQALREKPPGVDRWAGPYLPKPVPTDSWDQPFRYRSPGEHNPYDLYSLGPDGIEGQNNIVSWE